LTFIGPTAEAMEVMGSKISARRAAIAAGAPVVPGTTEALKSLDEARATATKFGYPIMVESVRGWRRQGNAAGRERIGFAIGIRSHAVRGCVSIWDSEIYLKK